MSAPVRVGEVLAGKYRVERVLGEGGMGVVLCATHLQLDQQVALKFLRPEAAANSEIVKRFSREARAAARIQSEHVARIYDVGTLDSGLPYLVMEYLEGEDLAHRLASQGPLPFQLVVQYVLEACEAVAEAHAAGIVHRDLKPANLYLARRANQSTVVKVLDFGISKDVKGCSDGVTTKTSAVLGSPFYMSPEQLTSARSVDARSDVWALGVILYELLSGVPPFLADSMPEVVALILASRPASIVARVASVPRELEAVIFRCMEKNPASRFESVGHLAQALAPFGNARAAMHVERIFHTLKIDPPLASPPRGDAGMPSGSLPTGPSPAIASSGVATAATWSDSTKGTSTSSRGGLFVGIGIALAAAAVVGVVAVRSVQKKTDVPEAAPTSAAAPPPSSPSNPLPVALPTLEPAPQPTPQPTSSTAPAPVVPSSAVSASTSTPRAAKPTKPAASSSHAPAAGPTAPAPARNPLDIQLK